MKRMIEQVKRFFRLKKGIIDLSVPKKLIEVSLRPINRMGMTQKVGCIIEQGEKK